MSESAPYDEVEVAIRKGSAAALRKRAAAQSEIAAEGSSIIEDYGPPFAIYSPEAKLAMKLAADFDAIADEIGGTL